MKNLYPACVLSKLLLAYYWLDTYSNGEVPAQAFEGGHDVDGQRIYVGRAFHEGDWLVAKVIPGKRAAYVSYNGEEIVKDRFQVNYSIL